MNATAVQAMIPSTAVSESSSFWRGDFVRLTEVSMVAIRPISVCMPVAVTTMAPVPRVTDVFWKSMLARSPSATSPDSTRGVFPDRRALAGERGLLRLERCGSHEPPVGRHDVAGLERHEVAGHEVGGRDERQLADAYLPPPTS